MSIAPITGVFETHLTVGDLDVSVAFYRDVVGLELAHRVAERHAAFLWIGGPGRAMLGLWSHHTSPLRMGLHLAFSMDAADVIVSEPVLMILVVFQGQISSRAPGAHRRL